MTSRDAPWMLSIALAIILGLTVLMLASIGRDIHPSDEEVIRSGAVEQAEEIVRVSTKVIEEYAEMHSGALPTLKLVREIGSGRGWPPELWVDPWGKCYFMRVRSGGGVFAIHSCGPDGIEDTADDVVSNSYRLIGGRLFLEHR